MPSTPIPKFLSSFPRTRSAVGISALSLALALPSMMLGESFHPGCSLPFKAIQEDRSIDQSCGKEGVAKTDAGEDQNWAKNNFCAQSDPVPITSATFSKLQSEVETRQIPFGNDKKLPRLDSQLKHQPTAMHLTRGEIRILTPLDASISYLTCLLPVLESAFPRVDVVVAEASIELKCSVTVDLRLPTSPRSCGGDHRRCCHGH